MKFCSFYSLSFHFSSLFFFIRSFPLLLPLSFYFCLSLSASHYLSLSPSLSLYLFFWCSSYHFTSPYYLLFTTLSSFSIFPSLRLIFSLLYLSLTFLLFITLNSLSLICSPFLYSILISLSFYFLLFVYLSVSLFALSVPPPILALNPLFLPTTL